MSSPQCCACGRTPDQILEYVLYAKDEGITPDKFVRLNEGTYNPEWQTFACTECYIAMGQPVSGRGWRAGPVIVRYQREAEKIEDLALADDHLGETWDALEEEEPYNPKVCGELEDMA